jgi:hypothetical protein
MVVADDNGDGKHQRWWMILAPNDNGLQDWAANYDREGQKRAVRDGKDSGVVMMAGAKMAAGEDISGR